MIIVKLTMCVLAGIIGHQTHPIIKGWERGGTGDGWTNGTRHGIGFIILYLSFMLSKHGLRLGTKEANEDTLHWLTSGVGVGTGVMIGYWLDEY